MIMNMAISCDFECDFEYPVEIKEKTENFPLCPYQTKADPDLFQII